MSESLHVVKSRDEVVIVVEGLGPGGRKDNGGAPVEAYVVENGAGCRYVVARNDIREFCTLTDIENRKDTVIIEDWPSADYGNTVVSTEEYEAMHRRGEFEGHILTTGRCTACDAKVIRVGNPTLISGPEHAFCGDPLCGFVIRTLG